jgi:hypothetical protein
VLLIKYWVTEPHCILQASKITYFSYSYSKLWFNKINLSSAGPHLGGATEVANELWSSIWNHDQAGRSWWSPGHKRDESGEVTTARSGTSIHARAMFGWKCTGAVCAHRGSDSGGAMQGRSRGRRWRVRLGAGILKFLWFQGFKPKDFEIQTKDTD